MGERGQAGINARDMAEQSLSRRTRCAIDGQEKQRMNDALEKLMQFYDQVEALGNFRKKTVGQIGTSPGIETTKCDYEAYEAMRTILIFRGENELAAWLDEMWQTIQQYQLQVAIYYKATKEQKS